MKRLALILSALAVCFCMLFTACAEDSGSKSDGDRSTDDDGKVGNVTDCEDEDIVYVECSFNESTGRYVSNFLGIGADFDLNDWKFFEWDTALIEDIMNRYFEGVSEVYPEIAASSYFKSVAVAVFHVPGLTEKELADTILENLGDIDIGYSDAKGEKKLVAVGGIPHWCVDVSGENNGVTGHGRVVAIRKGDYMAVMVISGFETDINDITDMFYTNLRPNQ